MREGSADDNNSTGLPCADTHATFYKWSAASRRIRTRGTPRHGYEKVNACTSPLSERVNLYSVLACEIDLQSYEEGRDEFLMLPPARLP